MVGQDVTVHEATRADTKAFLALLARADAPVLRSDADVETMLSSGVTVVAEDRTRLVCALACTFQNPVVAHLVCVAWAPPWTAEACLSMLLPHLMESLERRRARCVVHTAVEPWLLPGLQSHGFRLSTRVISYQLDSMVAPRLPAVPARIVPPAADLRSVVQVDREAFPVEWHYGDRLIRDAYETSAHFGVAEIGNRTVGYAYGSLHGRTCHLTRLAVIPTLCGRGIGSALLADAIADFARLGAQWMTLNTQEENTRSQRVYQAFGFHRVGTTVPFLCLDLDGSPEPGRA